MGTKLTKRHIQILRVVAERPQDVFDLSDTVTRNPNRVYDDCLALRGRGLLDWMYPEDEVAISKRGREALREASHDH